MKMTCSFIMKADGGERIVDISFPVEFEIAENLVGLSETFSEIERRVRPKMGRPDPDSKGLMPRLIGETATDEENGSPPFRRSASR